MPAGWVVERASGPASVLHAERPPPGLGRSVTFLDVTAPALVLGSTQPMDDVDGARAGAVGVEIVRRRTGGGAVLLRPGEVLWADVVLPAGDELWHDDVGAAFLWLGEVWAAALQSAGLDAVVHRGGPGRDPWLRRVCFAGCGSGEVTVAERKVVGLSQRRTRAACLFQCAVLLAWDPEALLDLLVLTPAERAEGSARLATSAAPVPSTAADVEAALLAALP